MDKLSMTCRCGQELLVPATAMNRTGLCPQCGARVRITPENTRSAAGLPATTGRPPGSGFLRHSRIPTEETQRSTQPRDEAARRFASAVDLYNTKRHAEALAILDGLLGDYPGDPDILCARDECLRALHGPPAVPREYEGRPVDTGSLNQDLVRGVILDKLVHGDDRAQLRAAELAIDLLGMNGEPGALGAETDGRKKTADWSFQRGQRVSRLEWSGDGGGTGEPAAEPEEATRRPTEDIN